jgi:diguanylate cyclase (GGDEF)-like protein
MLDHVDLDWNPLALESIASALQGSGLRLPMLFRIRAKDESLHVVEVTANSQTDHPVVQGMAVYIRSCNERAWPQRPSTRWGRFKCSGVLYVDLDGFKPVNDQFGHGAGDAVLAAVAQRFASRVRAGDLVARMGGDEFAVLCPEIESEAELEMLAERLAAAAREPVMVGDHAIQVGASVGACMSRPGSTSIDTLVEVADAAVYEAKARNSGGTHVVSLVHHGDPPT